MHTHTHTITITTYVYPEKFLLVMIEPVTVLSGTHTHTHTYVVAWYVIRVARKLGLLPDVGDRLKQGRGASTSRHLEHM
jgi:hypothetical protein